MVTAINPYLNFAGNAEEAFKFYKSVFGGEFATVQRYGDMPSEHPISDAEKNQILHISLPVGKNMLMASDAPASMGMSVTAGNNVHLSLDADSKEEADRLFSGLSAGGDVKMPMEDQFWGSYFGMCTDKFGIHWMISFQHQQQ